MAPSRAPTSRHSFSWRGCLVCSLALLLLMLACSVSFAAAVSFNIKASNGMTLKEKKELDEYRDSLLHPPPHVPDHTKVVQLAWSPRAFLFPNFLSQAECDFVVNYSRPIMVRSTVVDHGNKGSRVDEIRTSSGAFLPKYKHPVIKAIEERVADWTHLPLVNQEEMQVLQYQHDQKYGSHHDYFLNEKTNVTGPRYATVLMYLSNVELGGETVFPSSEPDRTTKDDTWSDCGKQGVAVKPVKGSALLFFSMNPDGSFDPASLHSGCPVIKGEKWSATKWIHSGRWDKPFRDPAVCKDDDEGCAEWAEDGECEQNPTYMKGTGTEQHELGFCRKSCGVCEPGSEGPNARAGRKAGARMRQIVRERELR